MSLQTDAYKQALAVGAIISLSDQDLTVEEILKIHFHPFHTCIAEECDGGYVGALLAYVDGVTCILPVPCNFCHGTGQSFYTSNS